MMTVSTEKTRFFKCCMGSRLEFQTMMGSFMELSLQKPGFSTLEDGKIVAA